MVEFALRHAYLVLFAATLVQQLGLPLPVVPLLLGAGALVRANRMTAGGAMALYLAASAFAHLLWFEAGRRYGTSVLKLICRISLEPDSCVRRTENLFARHGARFLLAAPFTPGLGMVAPPLAGMSGMGRTRFLLIDAAGGFLWAGVLIAAGYLFGPQLQTLLAALQQVAGSLTAAVLALLAAYILWKVVDRRRLFAELRIARITPHELRARLESGDVFVVDLRHAVEIAADGHSVPGALRIALEELEARHQEIPRDRDIVLFCS